MIAITRKISPKNETTNPSVVPRRTVLTWWLISPVSPPFNASSPIAPIILDTVTTIPTNGGRMTEADAHQIALFQKRFLFSRSGKGLSTASGDE